MGARRPGFEEAIQEAMAEVRGARIHQDTADSVDVTLRNLCERAEGAGEGGALMDALRRAEAAFASGDTAGAVNSLSRALIEASRSRPPSKTFGQ